jgi:hypothetical protein
MTGHPGWGKFTRQSGAIFHTFLPGEKIIIKIMGLPMALLWHWNC